MRRRLDEVGEGDDRAGLPGVFLFVQSQRAGQELDFVAEFGEDQGAGLKSGVLENAPAKG